MFVDESSVKAWKKRLPKDTREPYERKGDEPLMRRTFRVPRVRQIHQPPSLEGQKLLFE